jgi:ADP-ribosyl-[dinitrogen reductase] hydrolase
MKFDKDKIKGLLVGAMLGDALGAPHEMHRYIKACGQNYVYTGKLEFQTCVFNRFRKPNKRFLSVGQITDDSEMMITITRSLIRNSGYNEEDMIKSYLNWANNKNTWAMGKNTRKLFKGIKTVKGYDNRFNKINNIENMQSNGALMRCAPLALLDNKTALQDCMLTNPSLVAIDTNRVYLFMIRTILYGKGKKDIINNISSISQTKEVIDTITCALNSQFRDITVSKGWCLHGIYCSVYCLCHFDNYKDSINYIIGLGGDTDTNACIVGALLGTYYGYNELYKDNKSNIDILLQFDTSDSYYNTDSIYKLDDLDNVVQQLYDI